MYAVDPSLWVSVTTMYVEGAAAGWYESIENTPATANWTTFCQALHDRFDRDQNEALIRQLFHIKQISMVTDYVKRFSVLLDRLKSYSASTDPLFYTTRFIDGLKPELKAMILVSRPQTLDAAICMALVQEEVAKQVGSPSSHRPAARVEWSPKYTPRTALPLLPPPARVEKLAATTPTAEATASSSSAGALAAVKAYCRALGLCYKCNAKWTKDHKCAPEVLHAIEALWESLEPDDVPPEESTEETPTEQVFLAISKSAVPGVPAPRTIRLLGSMSGIPVHILVDSGSSSSFISDSLAAKLHHQDSVHLSSCVQVAGGGVLQSSLLLRQVQWSVSSCLFSTDFRVLSLGTFDAILGMDWLEAYSPMQVHWGLKWLAIPYGDRIQVLQGLPPDEPDHILFHIDDSVSASSSAVDTVPVPAPIQQLIDEFSELFEPPNALPPSRACNHEIPLLPGAQPVFIRPYRYPPKLKDEIETQVQEMLSQGLIQPSSSSFSSPVLLVKKKDGSYRFCVDFRHLNALTKKSKFPVPVFD